MRKQVSKYQPLRWEEGLKEHERVLYGFFGASNCEFCRIHVVLDIEDGGRPFRAVFADMGHSASGHDLRELKKRCEEHWQHQMQSHHELGRENEGFFWAHDKPLTGELLIGDAAKIRLDPQEE